jgi:molybdopterin-binding protein
MGCLRGRAPHMTVGMEVYAVVQASEVMIATA